MKLPVVYQLLLARDAFEDAQSAARESAFHRFRSIIQLDLSVELTLNAVLLETGAQPSGDSDKFTPRLQCVEQLMRAAGSKLPSGGEIKRLSAMSIIRGRTNARI